MPCTCYIRGSARPLPSWRVTWREYTPFGYSRVKCYICGCEWRTRADYVRRTPDAEAEGQRRIAFARQCVECVMLNECQAQGGFADDMACPNFKEIPNGRDSRNRLTNNK